MSQVRRPDTVTALLKDETQGDYPNCFFAEALALIAIARVCLRFPRRLVGAGFGNHSLDQSALSITQILMARTEHVLIKRLKIYFVQGPGVHPIAQLHAVALSVFANILRWCLRNACFALFQWEGVHLNKRCSQSQQPLGFHKSITASVARLFVTGLP